MISQDQEHLSDVSDMATRRENQFLEAALEHCRSQKTLEPTGLCHFCGEDVGKEAKFCDCDCARDYDHEQRMKKMRGKE